MALIMYNSTERMQLKAFHPLQIKFFLKSGAQDLF